jgi:hypothetical protein
VAGEAPLVHAPRIGTQEYKARLREAAAKGVETTAAAQRGIGRWGLDEAGPSHTSSSSDCAYKVVVVGDSGVGKTALLLRFVCDSYYDAGVSGTIGGNHSDAAICRDSDRDCPTAQQSAVARRALACSE